MVIVFSRSGGGGLGGQRGVGRFEWAGVGPRVHVEVGGEEPVQEQEVLLQREQVDTLVGEVGMQRRVEVVAVRGDNSVRSRSRLDLEDLADVGEVTRGPVGGAQCLDEERDDEIRDAPPRAARAR